MTHDYKYLDLVTKRPEWEESVNTVDRIKSEVLKQPSEAFATNLKRIAGFTVMPAVISGLALRDAHLAAFASLEAHGEIVPSLLDQLARDQSNPKKYNEVFEREAKKLQTDNTEKNIKLVNHGLQYIQTQLDNQQGMRESMEAILASVIIESWTAFESLAGDLWVAGVDNGPKEVVSRILLSKELLKPDDPVKPEMIPQLEYDARTAPGSWLREVGKVSFAKLDYIRLFYSEAFGREVKKLFDDLDGGLIFALSAFRNALTHAGGRADKKFKERVFGRFSEFDITKEGDRILLDGHLASRLNLVSARLGFALIRHIDNIVSAPKPD